jgi:hypothetical protein
MEREGDLRVWNIINPPYSPNHYSVETPQSGLALINQMADEQLKYSWIEANAFGLEVVEDGEWTEWYDENGDDIDSAEFN